MTLAPRVVLVHRTTELEELVARHGTRAQAAFFLAGRERSLDDVQVHHDATVTALTSVARAIPPDWRRGRVERSDLPRFLFEPGDVVVVVGQDGLVANVAKYLDGQPVIGIDPEPGVNTGVLVRHDARDTAELLHGAASVERRTMVEVASDDGQRLIALNEIYLGHASHQTSRYRLTVPGPSSERQGSSGLIVATGTGATGWCRSVWLERQSPLPLPAPTSTELAWFVREAWPSPVTGTSLTEGVLAGTELSIAVESDRLVAFGDGMEDDRIELNRGQRVSVRAASRSLCLVR